MLLSKTGIHGNFSDELTVALTLTNRIAILFILANIPFVFLYEDFTYQAMLLAATPMMFSTLVLLLNLSGFYYLSRVLLSLTVPVCVFFIDLLTITQIEEVFPGKIMIFSSITIPLVVFSLREYVAITFIATLILVLTFTLENLVETFPYKITHGYQSSALSEFLGVFFSALFIIFIIIHYKLVQVKLSQKTLQQNQELLRLNSSKDVFFSIIAHDLRNPLKSFLGFSNLIQNHFDKLSKEEIQRTFSQLNNSFGNLNNLLENLLKWSSAQMNEVSMVSQEVKLSPLIQESISIVENLAASKNIRLNYAPKQEITMLGDPNMISTVARNLITNAVKYTHEGGEVAITHEAYGGNVLVEIKDNGVGMEETIVESLFQLDKKFSTKGTKGEKGTGLGLILCKEFIEKMNGEIGVESKVDEGSTFFFTLPTI